MSTQGSSSVRASDPLVSAWVAANAGAGKTHTLANRVTRLLLADVEPAKVLCLTYTRAAAAEMQGRLFDQLGKWSMLGDAELFARVAEIGVDLSGPEDLNRARRLFAQALETPGGLKILTIHAFCQNVLARFPLEAGLPASFSVLDDQTARAVMAEARLRFLEHAGEGDTKGADALALLLTQTSETRLTEILDAALGADRRKLERFFEGLDSEPLDVAIRRGHGAEPADELVQQFCSALASRKDEVHAIAGWLAKGSSKDVTRSEEIARVFAMPRGLEKFKAWCEIFLTKEGVSRKNLATRPSEQRAPALFQKLQTLQDQASAAQEAYRASHAAALATAALIIADSVRGEYTKEKKARGALDYDDLINETLRLLERSTSASWVLYKLDEGIEHVLIDEAQDTSPEQWAIVRKLTEEFFASDSGALKTPRTIFAVGDEKQSIFSFQGADPKQFELNRVFFEHQAKQADHPFAVEPLVTSRRSAPEVLTFVDAVFAPAAIHQGLTSSVAPIRHEAHRTSSKGRVELWTTVKPDDAAEPDPWHPVDVESISSPAARLARQLAGEIKSWIGRLVLPGHDTCVRAGDIMVLLPRREPFGTEIIRHLKELNVPVSGTDRIVLTDQIAAMDLISLGRFALLPQDDYNLAALLRSPICDLSEEELFSLARPRETNLWRELTRRHEETPAWHATHEFLSEMRGRADFEPPYEFYAQALICQGMRLKLLRRLGPEANDIIDEFLSLALTYEATNTPSLEGFLHWLSLGGAQIKRDMERGRDEVRVMTVHGAKGLEADIVVLADTTRLPTAQQDRGSLLYTNRSVLFPLRNEEAPKVVLAAKRDAEQRKLEEHHRLLYVALTRARDRLIICGFESKNGIRPGSWYALAQAAANRLGIEVVAGENTVRAFGERGVIGPTSTTPQKSQAKTIPDWVQTPAPRVSTTPRLIRPFDASGLDEPAMISPFARNQRFRRGLLIHTLLKQLPDIAPHRRVEIATQFLSHHGLDSQAAAGLISETLTILEDPQFGASFGPGSRAEVAIVADLPELGQGARVNGRIDRLTDTGKNVIIVDFKTNRPPPGREEDVAGLYRTQMALYRAAVQKVFPGRQVACGLIWTQGPSLMMLSEGLLDRELAAIVRRLDPAKGRS